MRGNIAIRVFAAAAILALTYYGMYLVHASTQVTTELPSWNIADLPMQLGDWKGQDTELDQRLFVATGAHAIVNRTYTNSSGLSISLHFAVFTNPDTGIWHSPINCYNSAGWVLVSDNITQLPDNTDEKARVSLSEWKKSGDTAIVAYWFQLGDFRLYNRFDLGTSIRWKMRGQKSWPALIKVLLSVPAGRNAIETKTQMLDFTDLLYQWINQPSHQTGASVPPAAESNSEK